MADVARTKTWVADEVLTASDLNAEFDGILAGINSNALDQDNLSKTASYEFANVTVTNGGTVLVGNGSAVTTSSAGELQVLGTAAADSTVVIGQWAAAATGPKLSFIGSRHATIGSNTIVQDNDVLGTIEWMADDGTTFDTPGATIFARVNGTPGTNDMPTELVLATTADAGNTVTENIRLLSTGVAEFAGTIQPTATDGASLGTTSVNWSDLFLDSGAVIDFDGGDCVITHTANTLTLTGGTAVGFGAVTAINNATENELVTIGATTTELESESNLTFDGNDLHLLDGGGMVIGHTAQVTTSAATEFQVLGTGIGTDSAMTVGIFKADATGAGFNFLKSRSATIGGSGIVGLNDDVGTITWHVDDGTDYVSQVARIRGSMGGDAVGANDTSGQLTFWTAADGANTVSKRMTISSAGHMGYGTADEAARFAVFQTTENVSILEAHSTHASLSGTMVLGNSTRAASASVALFAGYSGDISDLEFKVTGAGEATADGSFTGSGADYQELFESSDGSALELGKCVVLVGDKVRIYDATTDDVTDIIGVVRTKKDNKNSAVLGNAAWNHWTHKYPTNDWGEYEHEDVTVWTWVNDEGTGRAVYERSQPEGWVPPEGATRSLQSVRKLNSEYVKPNPVEGEWDDEGYIPRRDRDEWQIIGLLGQVQTKAGEVVNPRWRKMKDISADVELWFVR